MELAAITPENTIFIILSFEGPDPYSMAGGLGTRVTNLSQAIAGSGFSTHLFFVGDPKAKGEELINHNLTLHRWCQWISEYYPYGVYHGETNKINDYNNSIPSFIIDRIIKPSMITNKLVVVLGEEWQTAEAVCQLSEQLRGNAIGNNIIPFWNANNTFGFDRIDWPRLDRNTIITTVSRYMKHIMREKGVNPLVIPNGIPESLLGKIDNKTANGLRENLNCKVLLTKVARYDSTKGWNEAIEATAKLNNKGIKTKLLARGGIESYGGEVLYNARQLGLQVKNVTVDSHGINNCLEAINDNDDADILNITFRCPPDLLRILYHASDAVLANSNHEPFGLVGLETMAAGGLAFTGGTGEDYAEHMHNAIVLETTDPREIEGYVTYLKNHEEKAADIRASAHQTASGFTWTEVIKGLIERLENQVTMRGILQHIVGDLKPKLELGCTPG